jgi:cupin fold WbuC family metalloprotein
LKILPATLLNELAAKAAASPRLRAHHNVHESATDPVQRFFVVAQRDSYFRPHRHLTKIETAIALYGQFHVVTFDDNGTVTGRYPIGEGSDSFGYETPRATWHTLVLTSDVVAFYEVKEGPYDPATAVEFPAWAPPEGEADARAYLEWARGAKVGDKR